MAFQLFLGGRGGEICGRGFGRRDGAGRLAGPDEVVHDVHGHGEDDGGVVLGGDAVQGLQVAELAKKEGGCSIIIIEVVGFFFKFYSVDDCCTSS